MTDTAAQCPVCSSMVVRSLPFHYEFRERRLQGYGCKACGTIFIHPQPSAAELQALYGADYFEGGDVRCGHIEGYFEAEPSSGVVDESLLSGIKALKPSGKFLEIGCAGGATLHAAQQMGYDAEGVELSEEASRMAREKYGLRVFTGDLVEAHLPDNAFDVVYMGDVLEHLPDPVHSLREIHRIMAPEGLLVIAVPSQTNTLFSRLGFLAYAILGRSAKVHLPPYHLFEYRPQSLRSLLERNGFRVQAMNQGIIPPAEINLRGPALQRIGKKILHYPNWVLTRTVRLCGDRITCFSTRTQVSIGK